MGDPDIGMPQSFEATLARNIAPEFPEYQKTKLTVDNIITQIEDGHWWFRELDGRLPRGRDNTNDGQQGNMLIVCKLTSDLKKDNLVLDEWFQKNRISTRDFEFDSICFNGSDNLLNLKQDEENRKVPLIKDELMKRMKDAEGV